MQRNVGVADDRPQHKNTQACRLAELVIEQYAGDILRLEEHLAVVAAEREGFRALAHAAVLRVYELTRDLERLNERHRELVAEYRACRERVPTGKAVAA